MASRPKAITATRGCDIHLALLDYLIADNCVLTVAACTVCIMSLNYCTPCSERKKSLHLFMCLSSVMHDVDMEFLSVSVSVSLSFFLSLSLPVFLSVIFIFFSTGRAIILFF